MIGADGRIKVGQSGNLPHRLCQLQTLTLGGVRPIRLVKAIECDNAGRVEGRTHKLLKAMGVWDGGEWFKTTASVASRMLNHAIRQLEVEAAEMLARAVLRRIIRLRANFPTYASAAAELRKIKSAKGEEFTETRAFRLFKGRPKAKD